MVNVTEVRFRNPAGKIHTARQISFESLAEGNAARALIEGIASDSQGKGVVIVPSERPNAFGYKDRVVSKAKELFDNTAQKIGVTAISPDNQTEDRAALLSQEYKDLTDRLKSDPKTSVVNYHAANFLTDASRWVTKHPKSEIAQDPAVKRFARDLVETDKRCDKVMDRVFGKEIVTFPHENVRVQRLNRYDGREVTASSKRRRKGR